MYVENAVREREKKDEKENRIEKKQRRTGDQ
jgi:hypothetical protein